LTSKTTKRFREALAALPEHVRAQAQSAYRLFQQDPRHPSLQFKQVHPTRPIYSVRVGLGYRALGVREADVIVWFWIGSHADYDRLLSQR
jgi:mRNA-degrading endonuclease RelE of RelBE toxin-antitoxin system